VVTKRHDSLNKGQENFRFIEFRRTHEHTHMTILLMSTPPGISLFLWLT